MMDETDEDKQLRAAALQNVQTILRQRQRAEQELRETKEALEEETRVLEILNRTGATLASNLDLHSLVQTVTDAATLLSGAELGAFYTADDAEASTFSLFALAGDARDHLAGDPDHTQWLGEPRLHIDGAPVVSVLAVPVVSRSGAVLGQLVFAHRQPEMFSDRAERLVSGIASQAAIAIDNARLFDDARRAAEARARLLESERAARLEVERVSLMKDEFLATLSHELRTPLNAVLGWSEMLLSRIQDQPEVRRGLETIARNARAQAQLIEDLLDMNRIVSGKIRLDVQRIDIAQVVEAALDSVGPTANGKSIAIHRSIDGDATTLFGDPNRLQQVVWNLLTNAVKFTPKGGSIDVDVRGVDGRLDIRVQDTGAGISPDFLPHVFERFRQWDASTTRRYSGLGLGLSIVKQLVELHGGTVSAHSPGEGQGATFVVSLPVHHDRERGAESQKVASTPPAPATVSLARLKVLVVDDEPDARELIQAVLVAADAEVITADAAADALLLVQRHRPDVIVSDIAMPERDGYQFIRDVRNLPADAGGRIPAIALTAFARSVDRTRAMLAGYQVHVSKPIEPQELVATIKSLAVNAADRGR